MGAFEAAFEARGGGFGLGLGSVAPLLGIAGTGHMRSLRPSAPRVLRSRDEQSRSMVLVAVAVDEVRDDGCG